MNTTVQPAPDTVEGDTVLAMCNQCGTTRTAKARAKMADLRCATCDRATRHARPFNAGEDYRECLNQETLRLSVDDKLDALRALGAEVYERDGQPGEDGRRSIVSVHWLPETGEIDVFVYPQAPALEKTLDAVLAWVAVPGEQRWFIKMRDGEVYAVATWATKR